MSGRIVIRIILALVLLGAIAGLGYYLFQVGYAQGQAVSLPAVTADGSTLVQPHFGGWGFHPFFGLGFGIFGLLIPFFLICMVFALIRGLIFGGMRAHAWRHGMWRHGPWGYGTWDPNKVGQSAEGRPDVPPFVEEWHKKMHEKKADS